MPTSFFWLQLVHFDYGEDAKILLIGVPTLSFYRVKYSKINFKISELIKMQKCIELQWKRIVLTFDMLVKFNIFYSLVCDAA